MNSHKGYLAQSEIITQWVVISCLCILIPQGIQSIWNNPLREVLQFCASILRDQDDLQVKLSRQQHRQLAGGAVSLTELF